VLFKSRKRQDTCSIEDFNQIRCDLLSLREEVDEQMQSINGNTDEIDIQNSFICEIDNRITKLEERMGDIHLLLKQLLIRSKLSVELSKDEQRVFLILYTHDKFLSAEKVSSKAVLDQGVVADALSSIMDKGIPLEREVLDGNVYFRMNNDFKLRQAKESIIKIDPDVTSQFQNALLQQFFEE
jgi:hypothetical protein